MTQAELEGALTRDGYAFARAPDVQGWLGGRPAGWDAFAESWNDLVPDAYLAQSGRERLRRHAVLSAAAGGPAVPAPRQPHYQSKEYNKLLGGVERWYEPIRPEVVASAPLTAALSFCLGAFARLRPGAAWKIELHQFRIAAAEGRAGRPTPEGVHRDGVDFAVVLLVRRENLVSGTTTVHDLSGAPLGSFTLADPLDAAFVDDARVMHGVTPVTALDPSRPAYRDVLVATFARSAA